MMIPQKMSGRQRGQALVEAVVVLPLLLFIFLLVLGLAEREESGFEAFMAARETVWSEGNAPSHKLETHIDRSEGRLMQASGEETMVRYSFMKHVIDRDPTTTMLSARVNPSSRTTTRVVYNNQLLNLFPLEEQKVYMITDTWASEETKENVLARSQDWVGERHLGEYRYGKIMWQNRMGPSSVQRK